MNVNAIILETVQFLPHIRYYSLLLERFTRPFLVCLFFRVIYEWMFSIRYLLWWLLIFWQLALWKLLPNPSHKTRKLLVFPPNYDGLLFIVSLLQTCSPPGLVLSLSPGLGSISDGVPSPGAFYRPASRTSPLYRPASRTSPPSRLGTSSPCNDLLMAMTNSPGEETFCIWFWANWNRDGEILFWKYVSFLLCGSDANISLFPFNV